MKRILLTTLIIFTTSFTYSQNINDQIEIMRELAPAERKEIVAENLMLNDEQSKIFWPIYDEYRAEARKIGSKKTETIEKFADNYEDISDEIAIEIMKEYFSIISQQNKLKSTYRTKMLKVLSGKHVLRYMQIENKMDALGDLILTSEIPLVLKDDN